VIRVMIVDDEPDIANSLYTMLQERLPFEAEIYKAYSGKAALEWVWRGKFDIVLTDIRMPVISGLELHKQIRALWPRCKMIFLTGHSEFDYVYEAINHDNTRYLLKTEGHEIILDTVARAALELAEERKLEGLMTQAMLQMEQTMPLMRSELLIDLLHGEEEDQGERAIQFRELAIDLDPNEEVMLMLAKLPSPVHGGRKVTKTQLHAGMKIMMEQYGYAWLRMSYVFVDKDTMAWFLQARKMPADGEIPEGEEDSPRDIPLAIRELAENMAGASFELFDFHLSFVLDPTPCPWTEVADRWVVLQQAQGRQVQEQSGLIEADTDSAERDRARLLRKSDRLGHCLADNQEETFVAEWQRLWKEEANVSTELFSAAFSLVFLRHIFSFNLQERLAAIVDLTPLWGQAKNRSEPEQLRAYYELLARHIFECQQREHREKREQTIEGIKQYILAHLGEDLSLVRLSEEVGLNPSYLSRMFKKATGQNVLAYIHETKRAAAQHMLCNTDRKIQDISAELGFISPPHFSRFFKKATGMSPQDYRNQASQ